MRTHETMRHETMRHETMRATRTTRLNDPAGLVDPRTGRRNVLRGLLGGAIGLVGAPLLSSTTGCAAISGEHDLSTYFILKKSPGGVFGGYTKINLSVTPGPDDQAVLKRVALYAPDGQKDLTFLTSILGVATPDGGMATPLIHGGNFPKNDSIGQMEILYSQNIEPFFQVESDGSSIRIDWSGQMDPNFVFPPNNILTINTLVTVEVM